MFHTRKCLFSLFLYLLIHVCVSVDTITRTGPVRYGDVLVSSGEAFAFGFFSPNNGTGDRYVGVWYNKVSVQTVVWVANRDSPITDSRSNVSVLVDDKSCNLVLQDADRGLAIWSSNASFSTSSSTNCSAQLLDTGNLVLFNGDSVAWQSFDYPSNTLLPHMKLGLEKGTGFNRFLRSWKSSLDPGTGQYSYKITLGGSPELFLYKGAARIWRSGSWDGIGWNGIPVITPNFIFNITYTDNSDEVVVMYTIRDPSIFSRLVLNESGMVERSTWHEGERRWVWFWSAPKETCDSYSYCGPNGYCNPYNATEFECTCFPGFDPESPRDWSLRDGSSGCIQKSNANVCSNGEGFVRLANAKIPDTSTARVNLTMGLNECEELCIRNCTCMGYANVDIVKGSGCVTWFGDMFDTRQFSDGGQDLYIRVDAAQLAQYKTKKSGVSQTNEVVAIVLPSVAALFLIVAFICWYTRRMKAKEKQDELLPLDMKSPKDSFARKEFNEDETSADLRLFDLNTIAAATDNFSLVNKLGEGGFGLVYKGRLQNGQEIAIKRLSISSGQGLEEFKNEVNLIAKLQHRNLVRLLGYCIQRDEKMLMYEYLPNKGLDGFIFDKEKAKLLNWKRRFEIILGIVRGLLYLHQDSRLRIIHRDLKASNVLLDADMNPKISDFGMAKIFGGENIEEKTRRVVGTYGYMSPEYAMEGLFSIKSDVFSFGVLLLEIVSGRKNNRDYLDDSVNLIGHIWFLWGKGEALSAVDSSLGQTYDAREIVRCIHVGLLCVQEVASDRPTMSEVASMLTSETTLPSPRQPAFIFKQSNYAKSSTSASTVPESIYDETITIVSPR